jgi:hypothetical protein
LALVAACAKLHGGRLVLGDNRPGLVAALELATTLLIFAAHNSSFFAPGSHSPAAGLGINQGELRVTMEKVPMTAEGYRPSTKN